MPKYKSCIQIRSRSFVVYNKFERSFSLRTENQLSSDQKLKERVTAEGETYKTYSGMLCPGAKKRITKSIEHITEAAFDQKSYQYTPKGTKKSVTAKFKLNFITLTIHSPQKMIDGKEGHKLCLEPMLKWLRDHYGLTMYVWKAELQERGQLHYHLTTNCFVHWRELWLKWGELNEKAGYLHEWFMQQPGYKVDDRGMLVRNYPVAGTDVHSCYKVSDMARYLQKCICKTTKRKDGSIISEFAKGMQNAASIGGKVWDCSRNLKSAKYYTIDCGGAVAEDLLQTIDLQAKKEAKSVFFSDHCSVYTFSRPAHQLIGKFWQDDYFESLRRMIRYQRDTEKEPARKVHKIPEKPVFDIDKVPKITYNTSLTLFSVLIPRELCSRSYSIFAN